MEIVGFYDSKFKYRHGGTTLHEHGRAKTKEQMTKQAEKRPVVQCHVELSCAVRLAARVLSGGVFSQAARVSS